MLNTLLLEVTSTYSPKFFRSRSGNGLLLINVFYKVLKSLINEQGGYVVFLVLSEYSFIRDFTHYVNHIVHLLTGNECSVAKAIQSCSMKTVYKIITWKWIRLMLFSKFWSLVAIFSSTSSLYVFPWFVSLRDIVLKQ